MTAMSYAQVAEMMAALAESIGGDYAYYSWPVGQAPEPPYLLFSYPTRQDVYADGRNYKKVQDLVIELITEEKDFAAEAAVEEGLEAAGFAYLRQGEEYLEDERLFEVVYTMQFVVRG